MIIKNNNSSTRRKKKNYFDYWLQKKFKICTNCIYYSNLSWKKKKHFFFCKMWNVMKIESDFFLMQIMFFFFWFVWIFEQFFLFVSLSKTRTDFVLFLTAHLLRPKKFNFIFFWILLAWLPTFKAFLWHRLSDVDCNKFVCLEFFWVRKVMEYWVSSMKLWRTVGCDLKTVGRGA